MPEGGFDWVPRPEVLSYEEIARLVTVFAGLGIRKVRLTGGEPTARADICELVRQVAATPGIDCVGMTTNALTLDRLAGPLAAAGLSRVNVSLDSLDADRFSAITRGGSLSRVLDGIQAARDAGLTPIKINAVLLDGVNDDEAVSLVEHFSAHADDTELRFIEYMPFEARWHKTVPSARTRDVLRSHFTLEPLRAEGETDGPARRWKVAETGLAVGFISPLSEHFCAKCNRLRLTLDGQLRTCLAHEDTPSLRDMLRQGASDGELRLAIQTMVLGKPEGHDCNIEGGKVFEGVMTGIGG